MRFLLTLSLITLVLTATVFAADANSAATTAALEAAPAPAAFEGIVKNSFTAGSGLTRDVRPLAHAETHRFFDRTNLIGFAVHAAIRGADAAQTCTFMNKNTQEAWLPMKSCGGIAAYSLSMVPAQIATSYFLHRRGAHRLERFVPYLWAAPSAAGISLSIRAW